MPYSSREQDCAERIKQAKIAVDKAHKAYSRGAGPDVLIRADRALAEAVNDLYVASSGTVSDDR